MPEHLVFTLAANLAAMGDLAGHERRGTLLWPGRSAVLGLVAAALGVRRDDAEGLSAVEALRTAVGVFDAGTPLRDYHTVETVPTAAARRPDSRSDALRRAGRATNTTITLRDYRAGVLYGVALWGASLAPVAAALRRPTFALYLGRKSCPLAVPPAPRIVEADGPVAALAQAELPDFRRVPIRGEERRPIGDVAGAPRHEGPPLRLIASDDPLPGARRETRHDQATNRRAWHFAAREVHVLHLGGPA